MTLHQTVHTPDRAACGCDAAPGLLPVDDAIAIGLALLRPLAETEHLPLARATGRVLARDIAAPVALPLFDNAGMDGYALRLSDLAGQGPWFLPVAGRIRAGDAASPLPQGAAMRILTGAPVPAGADAVIAQEQVARRAARIEIAQRPRNGQHIRRAGEDVALGAPLLEAGRLLGAREIAALAGSGVGQVPVTRRLRVSVLCSGSELVPPGAPLGPGQIWNANQAMLGAALAQPWIALRLRPALADTPALLQKHIAKTLRDTDILITTGGVSVGDEDHMARVIQNLGGQIHAMKLAMKPGKPLSIGQVGQTLWLGLPGNPVAAFVTWHVVGQVLAQALAGMARPGPVKSLAALAAPLRHSPGRCEFRPARLLGHDARGLQQVACLEGTGSHRLAQFPQADALVMIPADMDALPKGALVEVLPL
ncbi:gephyrin-like molybdotransferase Glp [Natronohydrobacter thiooxidans]|uniref:molybdopterin molybdotransferase MoeA n=1 Tax=Natronohydrobacter thiooxidans TaxID=87172 RepID=UPI0008FF6907|nr:gephyrin-like molybdotransferase Glp [Natronohydrobacter thiooxidans]